MQKREEKNSNRTLLTGVGACVRPNHFLEYSKNIPDFINWFELLADNFFHDSELEKNLPFVFEKPCVLHSVGMSIGSVQPLNKNYLNKIKKLDEKVGAVHISDHLCWCSLEDRQSFDLLPLPYCKESINLVSDKVKELEDFFSKPFLLENVSTYLPTPLDSMPEHEFLNAVLSKTNSFLLLDVNNVFVNATNHSFDPYLFIDNLNPDLIRQVHMAGHRKFDDYLLDNHGDFIDKKVWELYTYSIKKFGNLPTCIEWDQNIPDFKTYLEESKKIEAAYEH